MTYDEFEAAMLAAGWTLDQVEAMWQQHQQPDPWETEYPDWQSV